jgi:formate dehydrogenase subunit gamma
MKLYETLPSKQKPAVEEKPHAKIDYGTIEVDRHSLQYRIYHWSIVITGLIIGWTGLRLGGLYGVKFPDMQLALTLHVYIGLIFGGLFVLIFIYVLQHEWEWFSPARFPYAIKFFIQEALAWTHIGPHIEDPRGYDPDRKEYVEKLIPTEVMVLWMYLGLVAVMGITGLPLYFTGIFSPIIDFAGNFAGIFGLDDGTMLLRVIHRLVMYFFLMTMLIHAYAVIIFDVLGSMITGKKKERIIRR